MADAANEQAGPAGETDGEGPLALPISKLRGLTPQARLALKVRRVTTCGQLLRAAAKAEDRARLGSEAGLTADRLLELVQRADLARVNGVGAVFGMMLEDLDVRDVAALAGHDPADLHGRLRRYNQEERIARRSPTPEEVAEWVRQARALPVLVTY
jgi:predicted flap endonuclease-1-like 5' DNA nuclease